MIAQCTQSNPKIRKVRCYKNYSPYNFQRELSGVDWSAVMSSPDVEFCLQEFSRLFLAAVDRVAPFRDVRVKARTNPWMNDCILSGIKLRDKLLSQFRKDRGNSALYREFCKVRNRVQRDVKMARENFFKGKIEQNRGNSSKLWGQLKSLGYGKVGDGARIVLKEGDTNVFEPSPVARIFNVFYTSVASSLVSKLPTPSGLFSTHSFHFRSLYSHFAFVTSLLFPLSPTHS